MSLQNNKGWDSLITGLLILTLGLIAYIILLGEFDIHIGKISMGIHHVHPPFRLFIVLLSLKVWEKSYRDKYQLVKRIEWFLNTRYGIISIVTVFFVCASWIKLSQHYTFHTRAFDLSMYDSALSNTLKGDFMYTQWLGRNFFSEHFAPILLGILPLYLLYDSPALLLIVQALALTLALIPLFYLAKDTFANALIPFGIVLVYLNYKYLINGFMFDFHHEIFVPFFVFSLILSLRRNKLVLYFVFLILALACKEDMPVYLFMYGGYIAVVEKKWKVGIATMLLSGLWFVFALKIAIPMSFPDGYQPSRFLDRWSQYGQTYGQIIWGFLTHPSMIVGESFFKTLWGISAPLGFVPFAGLPQTLLILPPFLLNNTSNFVKQQYLDSYYALPVLPFLFVAFIAGMKRILDKFPQKHHIIMILFTYLFMMNVEFYLEFMQAFDISQHDIVGHQLVESIPPNVTIAAQTILIPHLDRTHDITMLPERNDAAYIFLDTERFHWPMSPVEYGNIINDIRTDLSYELLSDAEGFLLFKKYEE